MRNTVRLAFGGAIITSLSCTGPDTAIGLDAVVPEGFKHGVDANDRMKPASWKSFDDPEVLELVEQVRSSNRDLKAASAQAREFLALVGRASSASAVKVNGVGTGRGDIRNSNLRREFSAGISAAFEVDLWGRLEKATQSAASRAWASTAARDMLQLNLEAQAVSTHYTIQSLDSQIQSVKDAIGRLETVGVLVDKQVASGILGSFESSRVESAVHDLEAVQASLQQNRNIFENALAVLLGINPSLYTVETERLNESPPEIAIYLPSSLLERRPDIMEAQALLEANEADIGVAWADFFPRLNLLGLIGLSSPSIDRLLKSNEATTIGADVLGPILDGGERKANYQAAIARRDQALAIVEKRILVAFEDTENALSDVKTLRAQYEARKNAVADARETVEGVRKRHRDGIDSLFQLISVELRLNERERQMYDARGQQFVAAADAVRALGGDWKR